MPGWVLDESKFLSTREAKRLLAVARRRAETRGAGAERAAVNEYLIVHLALSTGLRVSEIAGLRCGDVFIRNGTSSLLVQKGKGSKRRLVPFDGDLRGHLARYLRWKQEQGQPTGDEAPLLLSPRTGTHMTTRGLQKAFKRCAARASISARYSIHSLRHTYACHLLRASGWNLRLVQKMLGHAHMATTQVYADIMAPDARRALEKLYR